MEPSRRGRPENERHQHKRLSKRVRQYWQQETPFGSRDKQADDAMEDQSPGQAPRSATETNPPRDQSYDVSRHKPRSEQKEIRRDTSQAAKAAKTAKTGEASSRQT
jgi:hypothetical protein